ncbi:MAG: CDP-alcohol phosphatidyltransferase family protein [Nitrospirae bacterium]|nr:CDP-alcohol phosphatidyltransferase family protein [Nitrospirota bacterium]
MLSNILGHALDKPLKAFALRIPLSPNSITIMGFCLTVASSFLLAHSLTWGALCLLPAGLCDMFDGIVARSKGESSVFGAFLDSVLDRYSDSAILLAIAWNLGSAGQMTGVCLAITALVGSLIISYARARAEALGVSCSHGLMERTERLILLFAGAVSGYMVPVLWLLAALTHFTVLQRILYTRKQLRGTN